MRRQTWLGLGLGLGLGLVFIGLGLNAAADPCRPGCNRVVRRRVDRLDWLCERRTRIEPFECVQVDRIRAVVERAA